MPDVELIESKTELTLHWSDGLASRFHAIWLRDNCCCESCGDPAIGRRKLRLSDLPTDITIETAQSEGNLMVSWSDGHQGEFSFQWLKQNSYDSDTRQLRQFKPILWQEPFTQDPPEFDFPTITSDKQKFYQLLLCLRDYGFVFIRHAPARSGTLEEFASRIGYIQETNFGRVQDLEFDRSKRSIANDVTELKPHTDEPYRASPPGILMFQCLVSDITGNGASTFLDGFAAAEQLRVEDPQGFASLTRNRQGFRRYFEDDVDLITEFPILNVDEFDNLVGLRINDRVHAPACIDADEVVVFYRGLKRLLQLVEEPNRMMRKILQPGDIALFDNHRILHGRTALSIHGRRWLQWAQIERGDFHSSLRIVADQLNKDRDVLPLMRGAYS
ncbi:MAG: alpha-ketoglutarate-dependent taurine dioxygenase [Parasphingorhabdus sp.]|jgi:alpha-ketoglutarate-dependent taurine dioxygenase